MDAEYDSGHSEESDERDNQKNGLTENAMRRAQGRVK
jgi:hypothetical protein